jgi:hypothetical protein
VISTEHLYRQVRDVRHRGMASIVGSLCLVLLEMYRDNKSWAVIFWMVAFHIGCFVWIAVAARKSNKMLDAETVQSIISS